ncbi:MAG: DUF3047 domain-containing protein [Balneolaceae bacterium]|nr:DUF3047 domain-containing protein [Balneolaceae bacterium]
MRAINYVLASQAEQGTKTANAYTDWVQMIVCQNGNSKTG